MEDKDMRHNGLWKSEFIFAPPDPFEQAAKDGHPPERNAAAACIPRSLDPRELQRAFQTTMQMLLRETAHIDAELEARLSDPLTAMIG